MVSPALTRTANMKHDCRLIAVDMDGTLLRRDKTVSEKNITAVNSALEQGIEVMIATGRSRAQAGRYIELFPDMRYLISSSGAVVYDMKDDWKKIISNEITPEIAVEILKFANGIDCFPIMSVEGQSVYNAAQAPYASEYGLGAYVHEINTYGTGVESVYEWYCEKLQPVESVSLYCRDESIRGDIVASLSHLPLYFALPGEPGVEISMKTANKGDALRSLCEQLGISISETVAVGDSDNDIPMLQIVGYAVAPANAAEAVKDVVDFVTADCDHDCVAEALEQIKLNPLYM